jgi:transcriptional regulator with XRE-family HTH domain
MPNTKKWSEIRATRSRPGVLKKVDGNRTKRAALLREVRRARQMTQETLAETLGMSQSEVSKVERRADVYVSTLRRYIEAMGGELQIVARFPNGETEIIQIAREHLSDLVDQVSAENARGEQFSDLVGKERR